MRYGEGLERRFGSRGTLPKCRAEGVAILNGPVKVDDIVVVLGHAMVMVGVVAVVGGVWLSWSICHCRC